MALEAVVATIKRRPEGKQTVEFTQGAAHRPCRGIWSKIARAIDHHMPCGQNAGPGVLEGDFDIGVATIIFEQDVIARAMLLDEIHFEQQRFELAIGDDDVKIGDFGHHTAVFVGELADIEIRTHAVTQGFGFADVQHAPLEILPDIDAGQKGHAFEALLEFVGVNHGGETQIGHELPPPQIITGR